VNRTVRRSPTVICALVDFAFVSIAAGAPGFERAVELLNRLFRHALVLDGVREIESRLDARQDEVRACWVVGEEPGTVERGGGGDSVRTRGCGPQCHWAGEAVADDAHHTFAYRILGRQEFDIIRGVALHGF